MWSPATSETVRLISRAGAAAAASRPPLNAETCLRTVLTSTMLIPEESSSSCRSRFSAAVTPVRGQAGERRAAAGEAGDHDVALARALRRARAGAAPRRSCARSAADGRSRSPRSARAPGGLVAADAITPPSRRSPRICSSSAAIASDALPAPTTSTRPRRIELVAARRRRSARRRRAPPRRRSPGRRRRRRARRPRGRAPRPGAALAACRERVGALDRRQRRRRGRGGRGGWIDRGHGSRQAATAVAASVSPG